VSSVGIGIGLALVAALATNLAALLKHRGCQGVAPVRIREPLRSARGLARSPWFAAGWGLAAVAWVIHVAAISLAPLSLVQAVLAGGAVTLAVMSQRLFGNPVERRQWLALILGGTGLGLLALTLPQFQGSHSAFSAAPILAFEGGLALLATALALGHRAARFERWHGILLATLAGLLFAFAGVAIKGLTGAESLTTPTLIVWVGAIVACGALAQYTAVAALQLGDAIETIGLMGVVANAAQIAGGVVVFGDPLSPDPAGLVVQGCAFAMVCCSALLLPSQGRLGPQPRVVPA
jgi:drug/metabolite transporter (DMT)-like permease